MSQSTVILHPPHGGAWRAFWVALTAYDHSKVNFWVALRNAIGIALPLALAIALHSTSTGVVAAVGALNVAAADDIDPYRNRARRMITSSIIVALAVFVGGIAASNGAIAFTFVVCGAFVAGLSVSLGPAVADTAVMTLVVIVIFSVQSMTPVDAALAATAAFLGGLLQTALSVALWPIRQLQPDKRLIGDLFAELASVAIAPLSFDSAPLASHQSSYVRESLNADPNAESEQARRHLLLMNHAERLRLSLLALRGIRVRVHGEMGLSTPHIDEFLAIASRALAYVGESLRNPSQVETAGQLPGAVELMELVRRSAEEVATAAERVHADQVIYRIETLARQLTATLELVSGGPASKAALSAVAATERRLHTPWRLQVDGWLATLRANLSLDSSACRHAIRLAICVAAADFIGRFLALERAYWITMTVALVLKPDFGNTFSRGILRLIGTYVGLLLATMLVFVVSPVSYSHYLIVGVIGILSFAFRAWGRANYGILVVAISALVVFLFSLSGVNASEVISTRAVNTTIGGSLALIIYWLWPTRERTQVPHALAGMLDGYRLYFQAVVRLYTDRQGLASHQLERVRLDGRRLRSNAETSVERFIAEPRADPAQIRRVQTILVSSHRFIHAAIALEAGEPPALSGTARDTFQSFAWDIEKSLYFLASRLRGSIMDQTKLPNLNESRQRLLQVEDCSYPACTLLVAGTEDLVNSTNLLADGVYAWTGGK